MSDFSFDFSPPPPSSSEGDFQGATGTTSTSDAARALAPAATSTDYGCEFFSLGNFMKGFPSRPNQQELDSGSSTEDNKTGAIHSISFGGDAAGNDESSFQEPKLELRYVNPPFIAHLQQEQRQEGQQRQEGESTGSEEHRGHRKDIVQGVYLGGLKIWSCANDLCDFIASGKLAPQGPKPRSVLELGCGHGLPCIAALALSFSAHHHQQQQHGNEGGVPAQSLWSDARYFAFHDFNKEVIEQCTKHNVAMNVHCHHPKEEEMDSGADLSLCFGYGDWATFTPTFGGANGAREDGTAVTTFDCILGSDVTYDPATCNALSATLCRLLTPCTGIALISTKVYYFGTRGGIVELRSALRHYGLRCCDTPLWESESSGSSMERVIVMVRKDDVELTE